MCFASSPSDDTGECAASISDGDTGNMYWDILRDTGESAVKNQSLIQRHRHFENRDIE